MQISGLYGIKPTPDVLMGEGQKSVLEDIISKYDPRNMSPEDKQAMKEELVEAGIPRSKEAMLMLREAGFSMRSEKAEGENPGLGHKTDPLKKGELWDLYRQYQAGQISEAEFREITSRDISAGSLFSFTS